MTNDEFEPVLAVEDLAKQYGECSAVRGVSFEIRSGEIFGLLGPNGAGKSTTIGMVAAVLAPSNGRISVSGTSPDIQIGAARKLIGLVPQSLGLYPSLTAEENLRFFGRIYGMDKTRLESRIDGLLDLTGLADRRNDRVYVYSGGMKRRLNLACGIVHEPKLLLLDEPTVGVDPQSRERIFAAVEELARAGMAVLYTTHYMEEAERLCHRVAIMDEGRFVAEGTVQELAGLLGQGSVVVVHFKRPPSSSLLDRLAGSGARREGSDRFLWSGDGVEELASEILQMAAIEKNPIRELLVHRPNLGEVFLHLTGKDLRD